MFNTPPFPSTILFLMNPDTDTTRNRSQWGFVSDIITKAGAFQPNMKLCITLNFNPFDETEWSRFDNLVGIFASNPNKEAIGTIGLSFEQIAGAGGAAFHRNVPEEIKALDRAQSIVQSRGFTFASYYPVGFHGSVAQRDKYLWFQHTNFPQSDPKASLEWESIGRSESMIGITHGADGGNLYPSPACNHNNGSWWNTSFLPHNFEDPKFTGDFYAPCKDLDAGVGFDPAIPFLSSQSASTPRLLVLN